MVHNRDREKIGGLDIEELSVFAIVKLVKTHNVLIENII